MTEQVIERCYLYRFFDSAGELLYVGITRDLGARLAAHRRVSEWWDLAARGATETYPSRAEAELAEAVAIHAERPLYNTNRPTEQKVARLCAARLAGEVVDVTELVAEVERLRATVAEHQVERVRMRAHLESARDAHRVMLGKWRQAETDTAVWKRKYLLLTDPPRETVAVPERTVDWGWE